MKGIPKRLPAIMPATNQPKMMTRTSHHTGKPSLPILQLGLLSSPEILMRRAILPISEEESLISAKIRYSAPSMIPPLCLLFLAVFFVQWAPLLQEDFYVGVSCRTLGRGGHGGM